MMRATLPYFIHYDDSTMLMVNGVVALVCIIIVGGMMSTCGFAYYIGEGRNMKLLEAMQLVSAMRFINLRYAVNLDLLLQILYYLNGSFMLNLCTALVKPDPLANAADPPKFQIEGYSG
jgi:hypothetical protein